MEGDGGKEDLCPSSHSKSTKICHVSAPDALTSDTAAIAPLAPCTPSLSAIHFVRDSKQITASEASLVLQEGPITSVIPVD